MFLRTNTLVNHIIITNNNNVSYVHVSIFVIKIITIAALYNFLLADPFILTRVIYCLIITKDLVGQICQYFINRSVLICTKNYVIQPSH